MIIARKIIASVLLAAALLLAGRGIVPNQASAAINCMGSGKGAAVCGGKKTAPFVGILDQSGGTVWEAYSVRCTTSAWLGKHVVNIRRASDSTTSDINCLAAASGGNKAGDFDSTALNTFCAATTCFVKIWYGQINGRDASQATTTAQPQILLSIFGNVPGLLFGAGSNFRLATASLSNSVFGAGGFVTFVSNFATLTSVTGDRTSIRTGFDMLLTGSKQLQFGITAATTSGVWNMPVNALTTGAHQFDIGYSSASNSNTPTINLDGALQTNTATTQPVGAITAEAGALTIGNFTSGSGGFPGHFGEVIYFSAQPNESTVHTNEKAYFGTP